MTLLDPTNIFDGARPVYTVIVGRDFTVDLLMDRFGEDSIELTWATSEID